MAISEVEQVLERWAPAWSSHDPEEVLSLFTDDCVFEDVTFAVVTRGKEALRDVPLSSGRLRFGYDRGPSGPLHLRGGPDPLPSGLRAEGEGRA